HAAAGVHQAHHQVPLRQRRHRARRLRRDRAVLHLRLPEQGHGQVAGGARAAPVEPAVARRVALAVLLPLAFLGLWTACVHFRWVTEGIIPPPSEVVGSWYTWIAGGPTKSLSPYSGTWVANVLYSGRRVLQGFLLAAGGRLPARVLLRWKP